MDGMVVSDTREIKVSKQATAVMRRFIDHSSLVTQSIRSVARVSVGQGPSTGRSGVDFEVNGVAFQGVDIKPSILRQSYCMTFFSRIVSRCGAGHVGCRAVSAPLVG
jgi:hypothetical protein